MSAWSCCEVLLLISPNGARRSHRLAEVGVRGGLQVQPPTRACDPGQDDISNKLPHESGGFVCCSALGDATTGGAGAATVRSPRRGLGGELTEPRSKPRDIVVSPAVFDFSLRESSRASSTPGRGGAPGLLSECKNLGSYSFFPGVAGMWPGYDGSPFLAPSIK